MATADLGIRILLQDGASAGLGTLNGSLGRIGYQIGTLSGVWNQLNSTMKVTAGIAGISGLTFAAFAGTLGYVVSQSETLQDALTNVSIAVRGTDQNAQAMQDTLIKIANASIFTSTQVADGFVSLGEHGQDAQAIINGVGQSMVYLAEAINVGTVPAADLLGSVLQEYDLQASDAKSVSDILTAAFYNGQPSASGLGDALRIVASTAVELNIPLRDVATALDILGQAGFQGDAAGTALYNMLKNLTDPTSKAIGELTNLGIATVNLTPQLYALAAQTNDLATKSEKINLNGSITELQKLYTVAERLGTLNTNQTFYQWAIANGYLNDSLYNSQGAFNGLLPAIDAIGKAIQDLPADQKVAALQSIFNIKGAQGISALVNDLAKIDPLWQQIQTTMSNTSAQQNANKQTSTLSASIKELKTTFADLAGTIGLTHDVALANFVQGINKLLSSFNALPDSVKSSIMNFLIAGTAISGVTFVLSSLITSFGIFGPLLKSIGPAFGDVTKFANPLKLSFGAMGGILKDFSGGLLNVGLGMFNLPFAKVGDMLGITSGGMKLADQAAIMLRGGFKSMGGAILNIIPTIAAFGVSSLTVIGPILLIIGAIVVIILIFTKFKVQAMAIVDILRDTFMPVFNDLKKAIVPELQSVGKSWNDMMKQAQPAINQLVEALKNAKPGLEVFGKIIAFIVGIVVGVVVELVKAFIKAIPMVIHVITSVIKILGDLGLIIKAVFHGQWGQALGFVKQLGVDTFGLIINYLKMVWTFVSTFVGGVIHWFQTLFDKLVGHSIITDGMKLIHNVITTIFNIISAFIKFFVAIVVGYFNLWVDAIKLVVSLITGHFNNFKQTLTDFYNNVNNNVIQPIVNAFNNIWNAIKNGVNSVLGDINNLKNTLLDLYNSTIGKLQGLLNTIGSIFSSGGGGGNQHPHVGSHATGYITNGPELAWIGEGGEQEVVLPVSKLIASVQMAMMQNQSNGAYGQNNNQPVIVNNIIDGKLISKTVTKGLKHDLSMNGFGRFGR